MHVSSALHLTSIVMENATVRYCNTFVAETFIASHSVLQVILLGRNYREGIKLFILAP